AISLACRSILRVVWSMAVPVRAGSCPRCSPRMPSGGKCCARLVAPPGWRGGLAPRSSHAYADNRACSTHARTHRHSPAHRLAHTTRISASGQDATLTVNSDSADTASFPGPVRPRHHCVALVGQFTPYSGSQTLFKAQLTRVIGMRLERAWIAVGGKA